MRKLTELLPSEQHILTIAQQKTIVRKKLLLERSELFKRAQDPPHWGERQFKNALKKLNLTLDDLHDSSKFRVACYFPIRNELNLAQFAAADWLFPAISTNKELAWFEFGDGKTGYVRNSMGIPEKTETFFYTKDMPQLICFVPGLAASENAYRLGYGQGYYDRFLSKMGEQVTSVLCLPAETFLFDVLPVERFDHKVDYIVF